MPPCAYLARLLSVWLRCRWYPNRRTPPRASRKAEAGKRTAAPASRLPPSAFVLALVAGMLAPAVSQASGRGPLVVARPPTAHNAVRALATAVATPTPPTTTTVPATATVTTTTTATPTVSTTATVQPTSSLTPAATNTVLPTATVTPTATGCATPYLHTVG